MHKGTPFNETMVIVCLVILFLSAACFVHAMRAVPEGEEDQSGYHDAGSASTCPLPR